MSLLLILLNVLIVIFGYLAVKYKKKVGDVEKPASDIPTLPTLPILWRSLRIKTSQDMWEFFQSIIKNMDRIVKVDLAWAGPFATNQIVFLSDHSYIEAVLSNPAAIEKADYFYKHVYELSPGVFTQKGKTWQSLRKPLNKLLQPRITESFHDTFVKHAELLNDKLAAKAGKGFFDFYPDICYCTLDIIIETHGGVHDAREISKNFDPQDLILILFVVFVRNVKPQYYYDITFYLTELGEKFKEKKTSLLKQAKAIVEKRLIILQEKGTDYTENKQYECYTDVIIDIGTERGLNADQMSAWLSDLIIAGFDSSAMVSAALIVFLAMHPEYQEKAYNELMSIIGDANTPPTINDLSKMTYLEQAFYETLRCIGVPIIARSLNEDIKLDNYILPKGCVVIPVFYKMHRDPRYWKHPDKFYPDHFLPDEISKRPKGIFMPFSKGPRGCPGKNYSLTLVKAVLSMVLRKFKFTTPITPENLKFDLSLMLEIAGGYQVEVFSRSSVIT